MLKKNLFDNVRRIVTHHGQAHMDEIMAIALVFAAMERTVPVIRQVPTKEELDDPTTLVLDVGGIHDPSKMCFDHHQFPRENLMNALALVADYMGIGAAMSSTHEWVFPLAVLDTQGPGAYCKELGLPSCNLLKAMDPMTEWWKSVFGAHVFVPSWMLCMLKDLGEWVLNTTQQRTLELDAAHATVAVVLIDGFKVGDFNPLIDTWGVRKAVFDIGLDISITKDPRSEGIRFFRRENTAALIDFSKLENDPRIAFAHKGGFLAVTKTPLGFTDIAELISKSRR